VLFNAEEHGFVGSEARVESPKANPNYHKKTDTIVDHEYAADIARAIAADAGSPLSDRFATLSLSP
jgi:hypothetical protein